MSKGRRFSIRAWTAAAAVLVAVAFAAPAAHAETSVRVTDSSTNPSVIGAPGNGSITMTNTSDGLDQGIDPPGFLIVQSQSIQLTPSCGTMTFPCDTPDPFVFFPDSPAHGRAGTACAGVSYFVIGVDPSTGTYVFSANQEDNFLMPQGIPGDTCTVDYTYTTEKAPKRDVSPLPGIQSFQPAKVAVINSLTPGSADSDVYASYGYGTITVASPPVLVAPTTCKKSNGKGKSASVAKHHKKHKKKCKKDGKGGKKKS